MHVHTPGVKVVFLLFWLAVSAVYTAPGAGQTTGSKPEKKPSTTEPTPETLPAQAGKLPTGPILRLDTGMHTAVIHRLGVDAANRYLVTGSLDKTVRVWELATGRLLRVLRHPIGTDNEGKLFAVALSPDGATVAAGGVTGYAWGSSYVIYLFDRASGRLIHRFTGLPGVVLHLAYSRDGRFLVATLFGKGIRLYRMQDYVQVASDEAYGDRSLWADFDTTGRLVTTSFDGFVRLYDNNWQLRAKHRVPGGALPYGIAFSPDGTRVAVGFINATIAHVLSGQDLSLLHAVETSGGAERRHFSRVSWSADGNWLYAGGWSYVPSEGANPIRRWAEGGRGAATNLPVTQNYLTHILPLAAGGVAFAAADPAFGILDATGKRQLFQGPTSADFRGDVRGFQIAHDGAAVQFSYQRLGGGAPTRFSLRDRLLTSPSTTDQSLAGPVTSAPGLTIAGWRETTTPTLNGTVLKLAPHEMSLSLAIAPDRERFLLGTEWFLHLFDRHGKHQWRTPAPGFVWSVNIAGNGQVAVVAYTDGTIRWHRLRDGKEILAFFPHADRKRWVLWTPSGFYDASPGAEKLIGWHVNRGPDQAADFFPVSRFRTAFFRPDVVARVIETLDEAEALRQANAVAPRSSQTLDVTRLLPPVVQMQAPQDGATVTTTMLTVRFSLRTPSGEPVTAIKGLVDGRPVAQTRGLRIAGQGAEVRELQIPLPQHDCEVAIIAENRHAASEPATVRLRWGGTTSALVNKPKLYILAIGISQYQNPDLALGLAAKDAQDFMLTMQRQKGRLYRDVEVKLLTNASATKQGLLDGLAWLEQQTASSDVAAIFLAGHGFNDQNSNYYFLPADIDTKRLSSTGVAFSDFRQTVSALRGRVLLFVDTCHAGNILWKQGRGTLSVTGAVNELASAENGAVVFAAATGNQTSQENPTWGNGAFTKALVEGLEGKAAAPGTGRITFLRLGEYISERVEDLTKGQQTPTLTPSPNVPNFPVALAQQG